MKTIYFDCFSGISGDMTLGALVDAGLSLAELKKDLAALGLDGFRLRARKVTRSGIGGTKVDVLLSEHAHHHDHDHGHRHLADILGIIAKSKLDSSVKRDASAVFQRLAEAEAKVHRVDIEAIHFHEVGALDAIVDVVGSCAGLARLGVERIIAAPVPTGCGFVDCAHGRLPVPAPATATLLKGFPIASSSIESELTTPTGAALLTTLADSFGPMPSMTVERIGWGAGSRELEGQANLLRVFIGETRESPERDRVRVLETNIDDLAPQVFETVFDRLFEAGALDAWAEPIQMKKSRPATKLCVIVPEALRAKAEEILFRETTTFGVRSWEADRAKLAREFARVKTKFGDITVKVGRLGGRALTAAPEYEDVKRAAAKHGIALRVVMDEARAAAAGLQDGRGKR